MQGPIVIIDYGMGNIESVANAFKYLGVECLISYDHQILAEAAALILPGVGAFHTAMQNLHERGLVDVLNEQVIDRRKNFLGICLGMQLIAKESEEITHSLGLGWVDGRVTKIPADTDHPVPHVGWNEINKQKEASLFKNLEDNSHFFFDHSYHLQCDENIIAASCDYGKNKIVASIQHDNIFAVQFHPEKSQRSGLKLLRNFLNIIK